MGPTILRGEGLSVFDLAHIAYHPELKVELAADAREKMRVSRQYIDRRIASGEVIRILPRMPMKLLIADRRLALVPLTLEQARDIALVLRPSLLLDALLDLFETMWERAAPFGTAAVSVPRSEKARRAIDFDRLVSLLAAGMNDKSIAQELGVSARTLERRILDLVKVLDARTRFQAGWQAAHRSSAKKNGQS